MKKTFIFTVLLMILLSSSRAFAFWIFSNSNPQDKTQVEVIQSKPPALEIFKEKTKEMSVKTGETIKEGAIKTKEVVTEKAAESKEKLKRYKEDYKGERKKELKQKRIERKKKVDEEKERQARLKEAEDIGQENEFELVKYNVPAGSNELDFFGIYGKRQINTKGVVTPDLSRLAYTEVHFYPSVKQVTSEIFLIELPDQKRVIRRILDAHVKNRKRIRFYRSGMKKVEDNVFRTLTIVDWSEDGRKLLVKERISQNLEGFISTSIWVYDIDDYKTYLVKNIREDVINYWKEKGVNLNNYRWDIKPMGWFKYQKDRVLVNVYGFKNDKTKVYMGTWLIGYKDGSVMFLTDKKDEYPVQENGLILREINHFTK